MESVIAIAWNTHVVTDAERNVHTRTLSATGEVVAESHLGGAYTVTRTFDGSRVATEEVREGSWLSRVSQTWRADGRLGTSVQHFSSPGASTLREWTYGTQHGWNGNTHSISHLWSGDFIGSLSESVTLDGQGLPHLRARGGLTDTWVHDAAGRVVTQAEAGSAPRVFSYGSDGRLALSLFVGESTAYEYDSRGRLHALRTPDGRTLTREYGDARGLLTKQSFGRPGSLQVTGFSYDAEGNLEARTEALGHATDEATTQFLYGPRKELLRVTQPEAGSVWNYDYDALGRLAAVTPPGGSLKRQEWRYDGLSRIRQHLDGAERWETIWTDGKAVTTAIPGGQVLERLTDSRGRLLEERVLAQGDSTPSVPVRRYFYDGLDALRGMSEGSRASSVFTYDGAHRLQTVFRAPEAIQYSYDGSSRRVATLTRGAAQTRYAYDSKNRLETVTGARGSPLVDDWAVSVTWEAGGARLLGLVDADGRTRETFGYDGPGRLETVDYGAAVGQRQYTFDGRGNPKSESFAGDTRTFAYDNADRLTSSTDWAGVLTSLVLHPDGTRRLETVGGVQRDYEYFPSGALKSVSVGGTPVASWTYASNGRVRERTTGGVTTTFSWDAFGTLVGATIPIQPGVPGVSASYEYDALGLRRRADVNGVVRTWSWVGETQVAEGDELVTSVGPFLVAQGDVRFEHDALGSIVGQRRVGATSFAQYGTWGALSGGTQLTANGHAGQRHEEALSLIENEQRWRDPDFGIFLSRDPIGASSYLSTPNALGPWSYANLSPLRYTDPDGRCSNADRRYAGELQRLGFKHATTELCIAASQRDEMDELFGLYQYARTDKRRAELTSRIAALERKASALEASYEIDVDRRRNVIDPLAGTVAVGVVATPVMVAAGATTAGAAGIKGLAVVGTFTGSVKLTGVATGTMWDGEKYRECAGSWYECDRVWAGVESSSSLLLSFYGAASMLRAQGRPLMSSQPQQGPAYLRTRGMNGLRSSRFNAVTEEQQVQLEREFVEVGGDPAMLRFNQGGQTAFVKSASGEEFIQVRGDVFPSSGAATHPRSTMTTRATLAHERGHSMFPDTTLPPGAWNDEFRASYWAAKNAPGLSFSERADLVRDALLRAEEAGVSVKPNALIKFFTSGGYSPAPSWWKPPPAAE